ncbi:MAG: acetyltransferase [Burkholderiaceae bacterium]|nr:MAG: acetyltransferase [Burkholderiaceae bacterium]
MNKPGLILVGAGGHAGAVIDVVEQHGEYQIVGLVGSHKEVQTRRLGYPVIGTDSDLSELAKMHKFALVTVGQIQSPDIRMRLYELAVQAGFQLPIIVAPSAYVSHHADLGAGSVVMHGAIVNAGAKVGANCIVNTRALLEHDVSIADHCHISTGAILNGNACVGAGSFVGSASVVREGVSLGKRCVVGMGLSVRHNQVDGAQLNGSNKQ